MLRLFEQFLNPVCLSLLLLGVGLLAWRRSRLSKTCLAAGMAVLLIGGNEWFGAWVAKPLERHFPAPDPVPQADAIVVLGGGIESRLSPRPTVELNECGDRVIYAFELFRQKKAPFILCSGASAVPGSGGVVEADDQSSLLRSLGVPPKALLVESTSLNTLQNASQSRPLIESKKFRSILLVTSAVHMPRSVAVFRRQIPGVQVVPAPTDFMFPDDPELPVSKLLERFVPSGERYARLERALHEYLGLLYYWLRGWI